MHQRTLTRIVVIIVCIGGLYVADIIDNDAHSESAAAIHDEYVTGVADIRDGDSLLIDGNRIRLQGIDAPELSQRCTRDGKDWACGEEAKRELKRIIANRNVRCNIVEYDKHGRAASHCYVGSMNINGEMVKRGMALAYRYHDKQYVPEENAARTAKRGLHASRYINPREWRQQNRR